MLCQDQTLTPQGWPEQPENSCEAIPLTQRGILAQQRPFTGETRLAGEVHPPERQEQKAAASTLPSPAVGGCVTGAHPSSVGRHLGHLWGGKSSQEHRSGCSGSQQGELAAALARQGLPLGTGSFFFAV